MIVKCVGYMHNMELCIEMISCSLVLLASLSAYLHVKAFSVPFCEHEDMFCEDQRG